MSEAYRDPLEAAGYRLTTPPVLVYAGTVQTPCGQGLKGYPIFYCPANQTIYSSAGSIADYGETVRLAGYWIAFHEYAHHVQRRIDVLAAAYTRDEEPAPDQPSDRAAGRLPHGHDRDLGAHHPAERDRPRRDGSAGATAAADEIHGKTASQLYWINRGFVPDDFAVAAPGRPPNTSAVGAVELRGKLCVRHT